MNTTVRLRREIDQKPVGSFFPGYFRLKGFENSRNKESCLKKADGIYSLFTSAVPFVYQNDWIAGSIRPYMIEKNDELNKKMDKMWEECPERGFITNSDHFSPDYREILSLGIPGFLNKIKKSEEKHAGNADRVNFLKAAEITIIGLKDRICLYADRCEQLKTVDGYDREKLNFIRENCKALTEKAPETFAQALQLVWMIHTGFLAEGRYAMALGRIDQYLYPFYEKDIKNGNLTKEFATELLENIFMKIYERRAFDHEDDVVNICIGGMSPSGECNVNELSYLVLEAVKNCNVPGPNLSARITPNISDDFLDACLKVIGTGLGYPALMNDTVNIKALSRFGYKTEDVYNYSMVGCIENFITGKQPPWSDGRFDSPRFFEYVFNKGKSYDGGSAGVDTGSLSDITSMEKFIEKFQIQLEHGAEEYMQNFYRRNWVEHPEKYTCPFLSCFCHDCIERGLDVNMGGSIYPSVHGVALMGIGTTCDSLAAIEQNVFVDRAFSLETLRDAMMMNFEGYEEIRQKLLDAPKYGNNNSFADKYASWFVDFLFDTFDKYKTKDGGGVYIAMAANISNISAGQLIGATPDGRSAGEPISDACSPTYGRDTEGPTATVLSVTKPSYDKVACGSVLNQKYSPNVFKDTKRKKLLNLIRVYFSKGGQEIQINATSTEILKDAMVHPENYADLIVRVSGFSAFYITLGEKVQLDILNRTQQS